MRLAAPSAACAAHARPLRVRCSASARRPAAAPRGLPPLAARCRPRHVLPHLPRAAAAPPPPDEADDDFFKRNDGLVRSAPVYAGAAGIASLLLNRVLSGGALVTDASSTQSRADVVVLAMATAVLLTVRLRAAGRRAACRAGALTRVSQGLQWKTVTQRAPVTVALAGEPVLFLHPALSPAAEAELRWAWSALQATTRAGAAAVFFRGARAMQAGVAPTPAAACAAPEAPLLGPICTRAVASGTGDYLANTALYPGRVEFYPYMPNNAQARLPSVAWLPLRACADGMWRDRASWCSRWARTACLCWPRARSAASRRWTSGGWRCWRRSWTARSTPPFSRRSNNSNPARLLSCAVPMTATCADCAVSACCASACPQLRSERLVAVLHAAQRGHLHERASAGQARPRNWRAAHRCGGVLHAALDVLAEQRVERRHGQPQQLERVARGRCIRL